jgi:macrolide transport system ATP-binding/permease protein
MTTWFRRVWHLINRPRFERELTREMRAHREMMAEPQAFGDQHRLLERSRDAWGWNWLDDARQDLRLGVRGLLQSPAFTLTAILILSFGIGLNLTVFQMANIVLLRGPAISRPETLARLHRHGQAMRANSEAMPYVAIQRIARDNTALSAVLAEASTPIIWGDEQTVVEASFVSANWFVEIGSGPLYGRVFIPQLDGAGDAPPTAIVSYQFWQTNLGANPALIGTTVRINDRPVTLIGVMPKTAPELDLDQSALWLPINQRDYYFPASTFLRDWTSNNTAMYGRLKDGVSPAAAREMLRTTMRAISQEQPAYFDSDEWLEPAMATENFTEPAERLAFIGVASVMGLLSSMVLLVAAANLGNLVLARATGRARELGVRVALGARRSRIVRQLAIETLPLGLAGTAGGLLFAAWAANTIAALSGAPLYLDFAPDWRALVVSLALTALALAVVGALPAWKVAQQDLAAAIKDGGQQVSMRLDRARVRRLMLAAQVGGSCLILIVSAMMARSLQRMLSSDLGFDYTQSTVLQTPLARYGIEGEAARSYWIAVKERVISHPETQEAAMVLSAPFSGRTNEPRYSEAPRLRVVENRVEREYFSLLDIPLLRGRTFESGDDPGTAVVISQALARQMYGSVDVVGLGFPKSRPQDTIVGVSGDASSIRPGAAGVAEIYRPLAPDDYSRALLLARARTDPKRLLPVLREAAQANAQVPFGVRLLKDDFDRRVSSSRIASGVAGSVGLLTLLLACIGIFGVVSYGASLRTKEIGIHLALGAGRGSILQLIMRGVLFPVSFGMAAGTIAAVPIGFALAQSPLQLAAADPLSYAGALVVLAAVGGAAALLPALRALGADPIRALRHE